MAVVRKMQQSPQFSENTNYITVFNYLNFRDLLRSKFRSQRRLNCNAHRDENNW